MAQRGKAHLAALQSEDCGKALRAAWPRTEISKQRGRALTLVCLLAASAAAYSYRLGHDPLGASEAYSALAASQPSLWMVGHSALSLDPGKPVLYHLLLHWSCRLTGSSEAGLRALSVVFGVASVWLVFALGHELFSFEIGLSAAILWAFNPLAVVFARWARMYSMLVACALAHLLALGKLRRGTRVAIVLTAGLLGAAMLYTHFGGILILAGDVVVGLREFRRQRRALIWFAVAISGAIFVPFVPLAIAQSKALLFGHWLDWLGTGQVSVGRIMLGGSGMVALLLWLALACPAAGERRESLQRCLVYAALPVAVLGVGSVVLRPMFEVRYVSPSLATGAVIAAYFLDCAGRRARNLATAGVGALFLTLLPFCYASRSDPWRAIAARIAVADNRKDAICFESGFFTAGGPGGSDGSGFPQGFFRVPFDYYFHGSNPRCVVPGWEPDRARKLIEAQVNAAGGAWLISARKWPDGAAELPGGPDMQVDVAERFSRMTVFHVRLVT